MWCRVVCAHQSLYSNPVEQRRLQYFHRTYSIQLNLSTSARCVDHNHSAHNYYSAPGLGDHASKVNWGYAFNEERHSVAGRGAHVGTHSSRSAYGAGTPARNVSWWNATESGLVPSPLNIHSRGHSSALYWNFVLFWLLIEVNTLHGAGTASYAVHPLVGDQHCEHTVQHDAH